TKRRCARDCTASTPVSCRRWRRRAARCSISLTRRGSSSSTWRGRWWDEARHAEIFQRLVEYMGGHPGDYVETEILWRCTQAMDPAARVAGINRGLEGLACDVFD